MLVGVRTFDLNLEFMKPVTRLMRSEERDEYMALSSKTNGLAVSMLALKNTPDIREEKVMEVKRKLKAGIYNVSMESLCDKIIAM